MNYPQLVACEFGYRPGSVRAQVMNISSQILHRTQPFDGDLVTAASNVILPFLAKRGGRAGAGSGFEFFEARGIVFEFEIGNDFIEIRDDSHQLFIVDPR